MRGNNGKEESWPDGGSGGRRRLREDVGQRRKKNVGSRKTEARVERAGIRWEGMGWNIDGEEGRSCEEIPRPRWKGVESNGRE